MEKSLRLAAVLRRELKNSNLNQLSKQLGISVSLLHDWYWGVSVPSSKNLWKVLRIAEALGLSLEQLLFDRTSKIETVALMTFNNAGKPFRVRIEKVDLAFGHPEPFAAKGDHS